MATAPEHRGLVLVYEEKKDWAEESELQDCWLEKMG